VHFTALSPSPDSYQRFGEGRGRGRLSGIKKKNIILFHLLNCPSNEMELSGFLRSG